jgi:hypothetical protein
MALGLTNIIGDNREYILATPALKAPTTCIDLNGSDDVYFTSTGDPYMDEENGWSLVACVNTDVAHDYDTVIGWHYGVIPSMIATCFTVGADYYQFGCLQGASNTWDDDGEGKRTTNTISDDTWYHLVGTGIWSSGAGWDIKFYLNGVAQTGSWSTSGYPTNGFTKPANMTVGLWDTGAESRWNGRANMIAAYQGVLTSDQVSFLYNNGVPKSPAHILTTVPSVHSLLSIGGTNDLVAYWPFAAVQSHGVGNSQASDFPKPSSAGFNIITAGNPGTYTSDYMGK